MNIIISAAAAALLAIGLAGNGFEMRRTRLSARSDEQLGTRNAFASRRNLKWYACVGAAFALMAVGTYA